MKGLFMMFFIGLSASMIATGLSFAYLGNPSCPCCKSKLKVAKSLHENQLFSCLACRQEWRQYGNLHIVKKSCQ